MPHSGAVLGVDLHRLLIIARDRLPEIAKMYLEANGHVAHTADIGVRAFTTRNRIYPAWEELRDEYQRILAKTAENLINTGLALERVVEYYASTDEEAAAKLRVLIDDRTHVDIARPPILPEPRMPEE